MQKKRGMTLIEVTIAMVLCAILLLVMTSQFVVSQKIISAINNEFLAGQEAVVVMNHITRNLRFALSFPSPKTTFSTLPKGYIYAKIKGGCLPNIPNDTFVRYQVNNQGELKYTLFTSPTNIGPITIAAGVDYLNTLWDATSKEFTTDLSITKGAGSPRTVIIHTKIQALPNL